MTPADPGVAQQLAELDATFDAQRAASRRHTAPGVEERRAHLGAICQLLRENRDAIVAALSVDFGYRSRHETELIEVFPALEAARHARARVARWMRPERKSTSRWFLPGRSRVVKQPLGVVGVIVPWNYPLYLAIGPLVSALAAGNRVMVKMSEFTPATGELLSRLLARHFAPDRVAVLNGGVEVARAFSGKAFDHLLFTGSTAVGREVMRSAAANLTPVTLELGGKSPAIIAPGFPIDVAARRIMFGKVLNAGQTCIAPDYVLLPSDRMEEFIEAARAIVGEYYPDGTASDDYSAIINDRHRARLAALVDDARAGGAVIIPLTGEAAPSARKFPPVIVTGVNGAMRAMQDEIFGPILPLVPYATLDEALGYVADHPHPLALYYFDYDQSRVARVVRESVAGGVTVNDTILHIAQEDLPFGGVGPSGMGCHHGESGFNTFSKRKGVFLQSRLNGVRLLSPPFGRRVERIIRMMLR